jgi:hypothetical protein
MNEELKKEWRDELKEKISAKEFGNVIHVDNLIHFISSLLAKQQEETFQEIVAYIKSKLNK